MKFDIFLHGWLLCCVLFTVYILISGVDFIKEGEEKKILTKKDNKKLYNNNDDDNDGNSQRILTMSIGRLVA